MKDVFKFGLSFILHCEIMQQLIHAGVAGEVRQ